jgi:hypothetical protein
MSQTNFTIKVTSIRTADNSNLQGIVKHVSWTITGERDGQSFSLFHQTTLSDPDETFIPFESLTEDQIISWVNATEKRINPIKAHVNLVLDRMVAEAALEEADLPWVTPPPPPPPAEGE